MKFTDKPKRILILLAVLCMAALLAIAGGRSYAAYVSRANQRGVAGNRNNQSVPFTSNYLQSCASSTDKTAYAGRTKLFSEDQKTSEKSLNVDIEIYNYANGNTELISQKDITYDLTIELSGGDGYGYSIEPNADSTTKNSDASTITYEFNKQTLIGRAANLKRYTITFPGTDLDKLKITAKAVPTGSSISATNNQILAAVIAPCTGSTTQTFHAEGKYLDESSSTNPTQYNGFNYEISITSGKANATLTWKPDVVEIDKFFLQKIGITDKDGMSEILTKGTLTFEMNQSDGTGDYVIPFYIKNKTTIQKNYKTWTLMKVKDNEVIKFAATQITEQ